MDRRALLILSALLLPWHIDPSVAAEIPRFECAGHVDLVAEHGVLAKRIVRGRVPSRGQVHVLVVFARFRDEAPWDTLAPAYADDLFDHDVPGSFSHFYREISFGQLEVDGQCLSRRYLSNRPARYYVVDTDTAAGEYGIFNVEILRRADLDVDFGQFDNDGPDGVPNSGDDDGYVDYLFVVLRSVPRNFLRGPSTGHASLGLESEHVTDDPAHSGGLVRIASDLGATLRAGGLAHGVGSMAHEFGHALGLPDLYDTSSLTRPDQAPEEDSAGIGNWGLMGRGATGWKGNDGPVPFCAWSREQLGWIGRNNENLVVVTEDLRNVVLSDVETGGKVYKIPIGKGGEVSVGEDTSEGPREYFLVEHRGSSGGYYDRNIPKDGLLIWHIGPASNNKMEERKRVDLECADGLFDENGMPDPVFGRDDLDLWTHDDAYRRARGGNLGDAGDVFDGERYTAFALETNPASDSYEGNFRSGSTGFRVEKIRRRGEDMTADILLPKWAGRIFGSVIWEGTVDVVGDVVVDRSASLNVQEGTVVRFAPRDSGGGGEDALRCELIVEGSFRVYGTDVEPVVFMSSASEPGEDDWYGISVCERLWELSGDFTGVGKTIMVEHALHGIFWSEHRGGPAVEVRSHWVRDSNGQFDRAANPGEAIEIMMRLANWSFHTLWDLDLSVYTDDEHVIKPEGKKPFYTTTLDPMPPGVASHLWHRVPVRISSECPGGHEILLRLEITDGDTVWTSFLRIPVVGLSEPKMPGFGSRVTLNEEELDVVTSPAGYALSQNYPNPFNPETTIRYDLPEGGVVRLFLYNLSGQKIRTLVDVHQMAGSYSVTWDGTDETGRAVASGVYLCRMESGGFSTVRKMLLVQ